MLKKHMAACLVATVFAAAPALAQTTAPAPSGGTDRPAASGSGSTTTGSSAMQPGAAKPATPAPGSSAMNQGGAAQGQFMTQMQANQMMASDLIGTRVISANNESIGDINDVIVDRNGQAVAAVIGVGGFLGIGEKDVAVPFSSLEFATSEQVSAMNNNAGNNSGNNVTTTGSTTTGAAGGSTNMAAGSSNNAGAAGSTGNASSNNNEPERVILRMTKAELQAAPTFNKQNDTSTGSAGAGNQSGAGGQSGTTAPQQ